MKLKQLLNCCLLVAVVLSFCACTSASTVAVTFDPNNGDPVVTVNLKQGALITGAPVPEKRSCDFLGWFVEDTPWDLTANTVDAPVTLTAKWSLTESAFEKDPNAGVHASGTDVRVCSFNVLAPSAGAQLSVVGRDTGLLNMVREYLPDVIAVQEFDKIWRLAFTKAFEGTDYRLVNADKSSIDNYVTNCTIAYRTSKLTMQWVHAYRYQTTDNMHARTVVWALFETNDEKKQQFIAVSTHWSTTAAHRVPEAQELATLVNGMVQQYKVPVVVMGDLNAYEVSGNQFALAYKDSTCYHTLVEKCSLYDAKYSAVKRGLVAETFHRGDGTGTRSDLSSGFWKLGPVSYRDNLVNVAASIDHIFYTAGLEALYYDTIISEEVLCISDHNPIYADLRFTSAS